jgi:hypothetical protein
MPRPANARHIRRRSGACQAKPGPATGRTHAGACAEKSRQNSVISAECWDRRRGCRAAGSPACFPHRASARAFAGRRPRADTIRRRSAPVCHPAARGLPRSSCPVALRCPVGSLTASANIRWRAPAPAGRFARAASQVTAAPGHPPRQTLPSACSQRRAGFSSSWRENGEPAQMFRREQPAFKICESGSARNAPSAASGAVRRG